MREDGKSLGCCNMLLWDMLCVIIVACGALPNTIHFVVRFIIGICAAIALLYLFSIPVVGIVFNFGFGLMWAYTIWETFRIGNWSFVQQNIVWKLVIGLLLAFGCLAIHITSSGGVLRNRIGRDSGAERAYRNGESEETCYSDEGEETQDDGIESEFENRRNAGFDPFAGCSSEESVIKRYKNLSKNFHPDVVDGNTEQMQILNDLYQKKLENINK